MLESRLAAAEQAKAAVEAELAKVRQRVGAAQALLEESQREVAATDAEQRRLRLSWGAELRSLQQQLAECRLRLESEAAGQRARLAAVVAERSALEAELAEEQRRHREAVEG